MFDNTEIVVIDKELDLIGKEIKLLKNQTLKFEGNGKLFNGILVGDESKIEAKNVEIFKDIKIKGNWNIEKATSNWFYLHNDAYEIEKEDLIEQDGTVVQVTKVKDNQYFIKDNPYKIGVKNNILYKDDTDNLQQLLNLKATHTVIEGNVKAMINGNESEDPSDYVYGGLTCRSFHNKTLEINGFLKQIPTTKNNASLLRIEFCKNFNLIGSGTFQGETLEHEGEAGEGCMGLYVHSTEYLNVKGLRFELFWGDGVFCSWNRRKIYDLTEEEINQRNNQSRHTWDSVKCYQNRRTGLAYEKGDFVDYTNCEFSYTSTIRATSTFSGVDIEPFGDASAPVRYCHSHSFIKCRIIGNDRGDGIRGERAINLVLRDNYFSKNNCDINLLRQAFVDVDRMWLKDKTTSPQDRIVIRGQSIVDANKSYSSRRFINSEYSHASVICTNNTIVNMEHTAFNGVFIDSLFQNNYLFNVNAIAYFNSFIDSKFIENTIKHCRANNHSSAFNDFAVISLSMDGGNDVTTGQPYICKNALIKDNIIYDYSNEVLLGSSNNPLPNISLRTAFITSRLNTAPERYVNVEVINNKFPREISFRPAIELHSFLSGGKKNIKISNEVGNLADNTILYVGDIVYDEVYKQKGVVEVGGFLKPSNKWLEIKPFIKVLPNTILFDTPRNTIMPTVNGGTLGKDWNGWVSGDVRYEKYQLTKPVINWTEIGETKSDNRPKEYLTVGRKLFDTTINKLIIYNGKEWIDSLGNKI